MNWLRNCSSSNRRGGLAALVASWLCNGQNHSLSANDVPALFANKFISDLAAQMNLEHMPVTKDLSGMIHELLDKLFG